MLVRTWLTPRPPFPICYPAGWEGTVIARTAVGALLLLGAVVLVGCSEEDTDDDAAVDDDSGGDDDLDDDSAADDDDDSAQAPPAGDWPTDLPPCGEYQEPPSWFEVSDLSELASSFFYGPNTDPIPGSVSTSGGLLTVVGDGWSIEITWVAPDVIPPFTDGDDVRVFCTWRDVDAGTTLLLIFDNEGNLLLMRTEAPLVSSPQSISIDMTVDYSCEYLDLEAIPLNPLLDWYRVYGRSVEGDIEGSTFEAQQPGQSFATNDGQYEVQVVRNYIAVPWTTSDCCAYEFLMEVVRGEG